MKKEIEILDLGEATALYAFGFNLSKLTPVQEDRRIYKIFIFDTEHPENKKHEDILELYRGRKLQVDAYAFYTANREIKNRIHAIDNQNKK